MSHKEGEGAKAFCDSRAQGLWRDRGKREVNIVQICVTKFMNAS